MHGFGPFTCLPVLFGFACLSAAAPETQQYPSSSEVIQPQPGFDTRSFFPQIATLSRPPVPRDTDDKFRFLVGAGEPNGLRHDYTTIAPEIREPEAYPETLVGLPESVFDPADCELAVGPTHILQVVNTSVMIFDKAIGKVVFQQSMDEVPGTVKGMFEDYVEADSLVYDPRCWYDTISKRFFITVMEKNTRLKRSRIHLGYSKTSNPLGGWGVLTIVTGRIISKVPHWADFNTSGWNKDSIVLPYLQFTYADKFYGSDIAVISKKPLLEEKPVTVKKFYVPGVFTIQPARTVDATVATIYGTSLQTDTTMRIYAFTGLPASPVMNTRDVAIPKVGLLSGSTPARAKAGRTLDAGLDRPQQTIFRKNRLYTTLPNKVAVTGGYRVGLAFYEFATNAYPTQYPTLLQSGLSYSGADDWSYPTLAVNADGDIGITYTSSKATSNPAVHFASRKPTDLKGKLTKFAVVKAANILDYKTKEEHRWGDYFGMAVDPADGLTFWGTAMVTNSGKWATAVFAHANRGVTNSVKNPYAFYKNQGASAVGKVSDLVSTDSKGVVMTSASTNTTFLASADFNTKVEGVRIRGRNLEVDVLTRGTEGVDMVLWIFNQRLFKYEKIGEWQNRAIGGPIKIANLQAALTDYVGADGRVQINVQGVHPTAFAVNVDYARVVFQTHKS